jgi:hypothetical protein
LGRGISRELSFTTWLTRESLGAFFAALASPAHENDRVKGLNMNHSSYISFLGNRGLVHNHKTLRRTVNTNHNRWLFITKSRFASSFSDAELIVSVSDKTGRHVDRCEAALELFILNWKVGAPVDEVLGHLGAKEVSKALGFRHITMIGGYVPLDWNLSDHLFCAYLFPDVSGWSGYTIYFTVTPSASHANSRPSIPSGTLSQFTVCHPDGYGEWHTAAGIRAPTF